MRDPGQKGRRGQRLVRASAPFCTAQRATPRRAVIVAGLEEQRGFGDICHFSERSLGSVWSGGEGPGGVPVHQERSGVRWIAKNVSEMFVSERAVGLVPQWLLVLHFSFYGLVLQLPRTSFRGGSEM